MFRTWFIKGCRTWGNFLGGGFIHIFCFHPYLGKISNLTFDYHFSDGLNPPIRIVVLELMSGSGGTPNL